MYKKTKIFSILSDFVDSNKDIAHVIIGENEYKNIYSAVGTLRQAIRKYNFNIRIAVHNGEIYLIRTIRKG